MIGGFGLLLVVVISVAFLVTNGVGSPGIGPGKRIKFFVAPLATSGLNLDANTNPRCDPSHPNLSGLNVCGRTALVLAFFITGSSDCVRQVDTLQAVSERFRDRPIQFAAVAVHSSLASAAAVVRSHHWTIPVAYDRDGAVGDVYGVEICPMLELAYRGGVVADRLIGNHWLSGRVLAARVRTLTG
jgi:peroxiredoxin